MDSFKAIGTGPAMHSALRKVCDSKITSAAWNAISLSDHGWEDFLLHVTPRFTQDLSHDEVVEIVRDSLLDFDYVGDSERSLLYCLFYLFEENDWYGMTAYLPNLLCVEDASV